MTIQLSTTVRGAGRGRPIDESGKVYGRWTVVRRANSKSLAALWVCRCTCGTMGIVRGWCLRNGSSKSCGCWTELKANPLPEGDAGKNRVLSNSKRNAVQRGYAWNLKDVFALKLFEGDCHYCGVAPTQECNGFFYNGIDRVNNALGYVADNVVSCCGICNSAKNNQTETQFLRWVERVYAHQRRMK